MRISEKARKAVSKWMLPEENDPMRGIARAVESLTGFCFTPSRAVESTRAFMKGLTNPESAILQVCSRPVREPYNWAEKRPPSWVFLLKAFNTHEEYNV